MTTGKTIALSRQTFVGKVMSLLLSMLSRLVITFLPRSKRLLISWLQSPSAVISEPKEIKSDIVSTVSPSICHEVMGPDAMIFISECWALSQLFHSRLSLSSRGFLVPLHFLPNAYQTLKFTCDSAGCYLRHELSWGTSVSLRLLFFELCSCLSALHLVQVLWPKKLMRASQVA